MRHLIRTSILLLFPLVPVALQAQTPAAKTPDSVVFVNGEQLTGELEKANGDGITFKSTMAGEITVPWKNIKTLTSSKTFAVLTAKLKVTKQTAPQVPQGAIAADAKTITVTGKETKTVPVADTKLFVDSAAFDKAVYHRPGFSQGWAGSASAGVSIVNSTQQSDTFNGAINLVKSSPSVDWLAARDRTSIAYNQSYGNTSQTGMPTVKTDIWSANLERDEYFSPRFFVTGTGGFSHSYAQTLQLQQAYGVGIGMTVIKNAKREFDVKGNMAYTRESFFLPSQNVNLVGSVFSESYIEHISKKNIIFNETGSLTPSYNLPSDYSFQFNANVVLPVYKGFGFSAGYGDTYLNNAPAGSNKNSTQFTSGITYAIKR